jgi:hypothetical protein
VRETSVPIASKLYELTSSDTGLVER